MNGSTDRNCVAYVSHKQMHTLLSIFWYVICYPRSQTSTFRYGPCVSDLFFVLSWGPSFLLFIYFLFSFSWPPRPQHRLPRTGLFPQDHTYHLFVRFLEDDYVWDDFPSNSFWSFRGNNCALPRFFQYFIWRFLLGCECRCSSCESCSNPCRHSSCVAGHQENVVQFAFWAFRICILPHTIRSICH